MVKYGCIMLKDFILDEKFMNALLYYIVTSFKLFEFTLKNYDILKNVCEIDSYLVLGKD